MHLSRTILFFFAFLTPQWVSAKPIGKVELAPAYIHVDVIENKHTVKDLDMPALRAEFFYALESGWCVKPFILYSKGKDGELANYALGFGRYIPIGKKFAVTPSIGISYTSLNATFHLDHEQLGHIKFRDHFKALAPYACMEFLWKCSEKFRICANIQYAWSHSNTSIKHLVHSKSDSEGPSYGLLAEYDLNRCWSINIGGAYNESFSREKNGLRARGMKIGLARWF